jgi:hypothetical protein
MERAKIEYCALLAEIVGAIAVVISVIYLALQITDNTSELQNQGHFNALMLAQRPLELLIADGELAAIIEAGYSAPEGLSKENWHRFAMYQVMAFNAWEYLYYANQSNSIPVNLWQGADSYYRDLAVSKPSLRRFWSEYEQIFAEPFRSYAASAFAYAASAESSNTLAASPTELLGPAS